MPNNPQGDSYFAEKLVRTLIACRSSNKGDLRLRTFEMAWPIIDRCGKRLTFDELLNNRWAMVDPDEFSLKMLKALRELGNPKPWKALKLAASLMLRHILEDRSPVQGRRPQLFAAAQLSPAVVELFDYVLALPEPSKSRSAPRNNENYERAIEYEARHPKATTYEISKKCRLPFNTVKQWRKEPHYRHEVWLTANEDKVIEEPNILGQFVVDLADKDIGALFTPAWDECLEDEH